MSLSDIKCLRKAYRKMEWLWIGRWAPVKLKQFSVFSAALLMHHLHFFPLYMDGPREHYWPVFVLFCLGWPGLFQVSQNLASQIEANVLLDQKATFGYVTFESKVIVSRNTRYRLNSGHSFHQPVSAYNGFVFAIYKSDQIYLFTK